jgi:hypothetical protein
MVYGWIVVVALLLVPAMLSLLQRMVRPRRGAPWITQN